VSSFRYDEVLVGTQFPLILTGDQRHLTTEDVQQRLAGVLVIRQFATADERNWVRLPSGAACTTWVARSLDAEAARADSSPPTVLRSRRSTRSDISFPPRAHDRAPPGDDTVTPGPDHLGHGTSLYKTDLY